MRSAIAVAAVAVTLSWLVPSGRVSAECITDTRSIEQRRQDTPLVFVGDVLSIENVLRPSGDLYRVQVRFRVVEPYRGMDPGEQAVSFGLTAGQFTFQVGQRVLVYATGTPGNYSTHCTGTKVVGAQDPEAQNLRRLVRK